MAQHGRHRPRVRGCDPTVIDQSEGRAELRPSDYGPSGSAGSAFGGVDVGPG
jgi:hypothetical protein